MTSMTLTRCFPGLLLTAVLSACGSGGGDSAPVSTVPAVDSAAATALNNSYNSSLAALTTIAGLQSTALADLFAATFLDAGYNKAQLQSNLALDAISVTTSPDIIPFPGVAISKAVVSNCNDKSICTLTATLTNNDVDLTETSFTTQVLYSGGKYLILGDQLSS